MLPMLIDPRFSFCGAVRARLRMSLIDPIGELRPVTITSSNEASGATIAKSFTGSYGSDFISVTAAALPLVMSSSV